MLWIRFSQKTHQLPSGIIFVFACYNCAVSALMLLVGWQEVHPVGKN